MYQFLLGCWEEDESNTVRTSRYDELMEVSHCLTPNYVRERA